MVKKVIIILSLIITCALWRGAILFPDANAQKRVPAKKYSKFQHSSHAGKVKSEITANKSAELDCAYCHGTAVKDKVGKDQSDIGVTLAYPSHKNGMAEEVTHSACVECHAFTGSKTERDMCTICHENISADQRKMATNIRRFPNPNGGGVSQFYDFYSHTNHVGYFKQEAKEKLFSGRVFFDSKKDAAANKGLDKDRFECTLCHTENQSQVTVGKLDFAAGLKMSAPGHPDCFICHLDPTIVAPSKKDKPDPTNTFATNCTGCHQATGKPRKENRPVTGSEHALLWFAREIVNTELNPAKAPQKPGQKPTAPAPFNHKAHRTDYDDSKDKAYNQGTQSCLICHESGKNANHRLEFFNEFRKTMSKQPSATSCIPCHKSEMQKKIGAVAALESAKCNTCHELQTIRARANTGVALPPPSHFGPMGGTLAKVNTPPTPTPTVSAPPTPAPAPTPTPTPKPAPTIAAVTPEPKPTSVPSAATPEPKPTPAPTPTPAPKPTPTPAPAAVTNVAVAATNTATTTNTAPTTAPTPAPPTPSPAPEPAKSTTPAAAPAASASRKPEPTGVVRLGDPKESDQWGQHAKWGVVENFNHGDHTKPKYSERCEDCHHTNKNAKVEEVLKCLTCHKGPDHPDTANKGGGVNVEDAYHGVPDSTKAPKAGCVECHKRYRDKDPSSKAPIKSPCSGCHTEKAALLNPRMYRPRNDDWVTASITSLTGWMRSSRANTFALIR